MGNTLSFNEKEFVQFFKNEKGAPAKFVITTLTKEDRKLYKVNSSELWLSRASLDEHLKRHPEIGIVDYLRIPEIVRNADVWGGHKERRFLLINIGGVAYRAAIKVTQDHSEAWFLSLVVSPKQKPPKGAALLRKGAGGPGWRP